MTYKRCTLCNKQAPPDNIYCFKCRCKVLEKPFRSRGGSKFKIAHDRAVYYGVVANDLTAEDWQVILDTYGSKCLKCGSIDKVQIDHVVPLSKLGGNTISNVQPLCEKCNSYKFTGTNDYRPDRGAAIQAIAQRKAQDHG